MATAVHDGHLSGVFGPLSFTSSGGGVYGRSFIAAGLMASLLALPLSYTATRNGLGLTEKASAIETATGVKSTATVAFDRSSVANKVTQ